jgi:hypothetical protein
LLIHSAFGGVKTRISLGNQGDCSNLFTPVLACAGYLLIRQVLGEFFISNLGG